MAAMSNIVALIFLSFSMAAELPQSIKEVTTTESGAKWCPVPLAGTQCPDSSIFHYYECCHDMLKDCCFVFQTWVVVLGIGVLVLIGASIVLSVVRCVFCRRN